MNLRLFFLLEVLLIILLPHAVTSAEIIEVLIPDIQGVFTHGEVEVRIDTFFLDRTPDEIYSVKLCLVGQGINGLSATDGPIGCIGDGMIYTININGEETTSRWYPLPIISAIITYDLNDEIELITENGWEGLKTYEGVISFSAVPRPLSNPFNSWWCLYPQIELTLVKLVIEADFEVGIAPTTWGRIKSLFIIN